ERAESLSLDLTVQPARAVRGTVVGPDGAPLAGAKVAGLTSANDLETLERASFTVEGLNPRGTRELFFHHAGRSLGKSVTVRGAEADPVPGRLDPLGGVPGRTVDRGGKPVAGATVSFVCGMAGREITGRTDRDGRFRANVVAGQQYSLASNPRLLPGSVVTAE